MKQMRYQVSGASTMKTDETGRMVEFGEFPELETKRLVLRTYPESESVEIVLVVLTCL